MKRSAYFAATTTRREEASVHIPPDRARVKVGRKDAVPCTFTQTAKMREEQAKRRAARKDLFAQKRESVQIPMRNMRETQMLARRAGSYALPQQDMAGADTDICLLRAAAALGDIKINAGTHAHAVLLIDAMPVHARLLSPAAAIFIRHRH